MADLKDAIEGIKKTIEDAVASGDLIPRADAQAAVARGMERAAEIFAEMWRENDGYRIAKIRAEAAAIRRGETP